jgi:hypothetical protein
VGWRIWDRCIDLGQAPAFADLDLLGAAWPAPADDPYNARLKAANLAAVWANYQQAGCQRLIVAGVVESVAERRLLEDATGGPVVICRLDASDAELALRIERRGREEGDDLTRLAARAAELSAQLAADGLSDFSVATGGRSTGEVAGEVLARWT